MTLNTVQFKILKNILSVHILKSLNLTETTSVDRSSQGHSYQPDFLRDSHQRSAVQFHQYGGHAGAWMRPKNVFISLSGVLTISQEI